MMFPGNSEYWMRWLMQFSTSEHREAWRGVMCVLRWLAIREANAIPPPGGVETIEDDVIHSSLLRRLIEGKDPLPVPPPESFGRPWYELIETGHAENLTVCPVGEIKNTHMLINNDVWRVLQQLSADEWLVAYRADGDVFRLVRENDRWRLDRAAEASTPSSE